MPKLRKHTPKAYIETVLIADEDPIAAGNQWEASEWAGSQPIELPGRPADKRTAAPTQVPTKVFV